MINTQTARSAAIAQGDWIWVESLWGKVRCMAGLSEAVEPGTVWTWNAVGKAAGAWALAADANESRLGFLLNHLISEELPSDHGNARISNSDPITGQAGWYDVRVRIYRAEPASGAERTEPQFEPMRPYPGMEQKAGLLAALGRGAAPIARGRK
jgi:anaerobic selenocysteine-containing dehydrogenase